MRGWATEYQGCECINPRKPPSLAEQKGSTHAVPASRDRVVCRPNERTRRKETGLQIRTRGWACTHRYVSCRGPQISPRPVNMPVMSEADPRRRGDG